MRYSAVYFIIGLFLLPWTLKTQDLDNRAGDEAALEALYVSTNGNNWNNSDSCSSSGMSLSDNILGVKVATIGGELRVTQIDLRYNNLTGSIDLPELGNFKQMTLFHATHNFLDIDYPNYLHNATGLEYLHLSYSDYSLEDESYPSMQPHEYVPMKGPGHLDPGKDSSTGNNRIHSRVDDTIDQLTNLKYFVLSYTDDFGANSRTPKTVNGIEDISQDLWNISNLEVIQIYDNCNIAASGNTFSSLSSIGHILGLEQVFLGGGTGTTWDEVDQLYT